MTGIFIRQRVPIPERGRYPVEKMHILGIHPIRGSCVERFFKNFEAEEKRLNREKLKEKSSWQYFFAQHSVFLILVLFAIFLATLRFAREAAPMVGLPCIMSIGGIFTLLIRLDQTTPWESDSFKKFEEEYRNSMGHVWQHMSRSLANSDELDSNLDFAVLYHPLCSRRFLYMRRRLNHPFEEKAETYCMDTWEK